MNLILVRHGEIPSNINKVYAGRSPETLTDKGVKQAVDVSERLNACHVDALYTSPIKRAVQTAGIISERLNIDVKVNTAFRELEMGPWEGMSESAIAQDYPVEWNIWNSRPADLRLYGRETLGELLERVLEGIQGVYPQAERNSIIIVTHVAIIRVLLLWHEKKSLNLYKTIHVPNAEIFNIAVSAFS